ncbi:MAG: hypothetical protein ACM336_08785 [Acidobacteriota bacterium]
MPSFKIHRLKDSQFQQFRWAPHTAGTSQARPKDYLPAGTVEAPSAYAAWAALKDSAEPLRVGDILESEDGRLCICKYVGFEEARWFVPEPKPVPAEAPKPDLAGVTDGMRP